MITKGRHQATKHVPTSVAIVSLPGIGKRSNVRLITCHKIPTIFLWKALKL